MEENVNGHNQQPVDIIEAHVGNCVVVNVILHSTTWICQRMDEFDCG